MLSVAAYPMSRQVAAPFVRRGGLLAYAACAASLSIWLFTLVLHYWFESSFEDVQEQASQGSTVRTDFLVGFLLCLAAHLTLGISAWMSAPFQIMSTWSGRLFTIFCAFILLVSPLSAVATTSALYSFGTWAVFLLLFLYWQSDYRVVRRMLVVAGFVLLAWMFILLCKHGIKFGFAIGGINRNTSAAVALAGMICCMMSPMKSVRWAAIIAAVFMALAVNSRGTMTAMLIFFVAYYTCYKGTLRAAVHALLAVAALIAVMLAVPSLNDLLFNRILMLHDAARGVRSGFSGRFELWQQAFSAFWENPIFGVGFRATTHRGRGDFGGVHSGYLKIFVETGFIGAFLVIGAVVTEGIRRFRLALRFRDMPPERAPMLNVAETTRINAVACGTIAMMLGYWIYEQLYINIGSAISIVFFLMMVAPAYITRQGNSLR